VEVNCQTDFVARNDAFVKLLNDVTNLAFENAVNTPAEVAAEIAAGGGRAAVFALVEKLDYFRRPLESPAKVAYMGTKLLRYESGGTRSEAKFNYSDDAAARTLVDWLDRMGESAEIHIDLERAAKYDHLGVMKVLNVLAAAMEDHRVAAGGQFLPLLDRIAGNETYMHTARTLAADLAEAIRNPKK